MCVFALIAASIGPSTHLQGDMIPVAPPTGEQEEAVRALSERYIEKGEELEKIGDLKGAVLDYAEAIRVDPDNPEAYVRRGNAKLAMKDSDGAHDDFSEALEVDGKYAEAYYRRGLVRQAKEDYVGAMADLTRAVEINPSRKEYFYDRGKLRFKVRDYPGAAEDFDRYSMMDRDAVGGILRRGLARFYAGDNDKALEDFNKALKMNPRIPHAYYLRALYKMNVKLYDGATVDLAKAISLNPENGLYPFARGALLYANGDHRGARQDFERCKAFSGEASLKDYVVLWIWLLDAWEYGLATAKAKLAHYYKIREFEVVDPWYGQIVRFLLGEMSEDAFLREAEEFPQRDLDERLSHAAFFAAQKRLMDKNDKAAQRLLLVCVDKGHLGAFEFQAARMQLGSSLADE